MRFRRLNLFQKCVFAFLAALAVIFAAVYARTVSRVGYEYMGEILVPSQADGCTVYSGEIAGEEAAFTVTEDGAVTFRYGDKTYGPYTMEEDPSAIPDDADAGMTGIVLREGEEILFRGGMLEVDEGDHVWISADSFAYDLTGSVDPDDDDGFAPAVCDILQLMTGPELTHKGTWFAWLGAVLISVIDMAAALYEEELFRWRLKFLIRDPWKAEPARAVLADRYFTAVLFVILTLYIYVIGLE